MTPLILAAIAAVAVVAGFLALRQFRNRRRGERNFEGTFTFGWEVSSFVPGDPSNTAPRFWVDWTPESGFLEKFRAQGFDPAWSPGYGTVRTKFIGKFENGSKDGYGHMGQYSGQVTVLSVLQMSPIEARS